MSYQHCGDSERAILSCFLNDSSTLEDARDTLPAEVFHHPANRLMFEEMLAFTASGRPLDYVLFTSFLRDRGNLERVGGAGELSVVLNTTQSSVGYKHYHGILRSKYLFREGQKVLERGVAMIPEYMDRLPDWTGRVSEEVLQLHQKAIGKCDADAGGGVKEAYFDLIDNFGKTGVTFGFPWLDQQLGGMGEGRVILFAGKRGTGKSALVGQIAWHASAKLEQPKRSDLVGLEMTRREYFQRICSNEGVDASAWLTGKLTRRDMEVLNRVKELVHVPIRFHDDVVEQAKILSSLRMCHLKHGTRIAVVDGPQKVVGDKKEGRERELSKIVQDYKELARRTGMTILLPIHMNKDLVARGSEDIENYADQMVTMVADAEQSPDTPDHLKRILFKITKNRHGIEGKRCLYRLNGKHMIFEEVGETEQDIELTSKPKSTRYGN
jgi:replicative DNA helicase